MKFLNIKDLYRKIGFTRYKRIKLYLSNLKNKIKITNDDDVKLLDEIDILIQERLRAVRILYVVGSVSYFGLYFSFISIFLSELIFFNEFTKIISNLVGIIGTTLFIVILFFSNKLNDLYYQDINLLAAHAISIYNIYKTKDGKQLYEDMNNYISFINFFKKRY